MTFAKLVQALADTGRVPDGARQPASIVLGSAEGAPNRALGIDVRAPRPVTAAQTARLRATRRALG
jgi:hypothetical protein